MAILNDVKTALSVVGDHADAALDLHIETVREYLRNAGVSEAAIEGAEARGCIIRGVADLWNASSGDVRFSQVFNDLAVHLAVTRQQEVSDDDPALP